MKTLLTTGLFLIYTACFTQIPNHAKTIIVKNVSFNEVCNALLDSGYSIEKKDNDLQTVRTEEKQYPKYWNAKYIINVRVKDSIAYITGTFTAANLLKDEPIEYVTDKKGVPYSKSVYTYSFMLINHFAQAFKKEIEYK